jgi:hypothetical protein
MNYQTIRALLDTQASTAIGIPTMQKENTRITVVNKTPWCRSTLITAEPSDLGVGSSAMAAYRGLYQLCLMYPAAAGTTTPSTVAAAIQSALPRGYMATGSGITVQIEMSWQETAYEFEGWYVIPVTTRWVCYALPQ